MVPNLGGVPLFRLGSGGGARRFKESTCWIPTKNGSYRNNFLWISTWRYKILRCYWLIHTNYAVLILSPRLWTVWTCLETCRVPERRVPKNQKLEDVTWSNCTVLLQGTKPQSGGHGCLKIKADVSRELGIPGHNLKRPVMALRGLRSWASNHQVDKVSNTFPSHFLVTWQLCSRAVSSWYPHWCRTKSYFDMMHAVRTDWTTQSDLIWSLILPFPSMLLTLLYLYSSRF